MATPKTLAEKVKLRRYRSPAHCMASYFRIPRISDVVNGMIGDTSAADCIKAIEQEGFWGFVDTKRLVLHFWIQPGKARPGRLAFFFAHELGHIYDERAKELRKRPRWFPAKEWEADAWGEVAQRATALASRYSG